MNKLGKFEILGKIGQGAMGVVYKARDPFIDRIVALKTLTTGISEDPHHFEAVLFRGALGGKPAPPRTSSRFTNWGTRATCRSSPCNF